MKLECGKSWAAKVKYLEQWHPFFPFFPRRVGEYDCRAFEWIERKGELMHGYESGDYWHWQYRLHPQHNSQLSEKS